MTTPYNASTPAEWALVMRKAVELALRSGEVVSRRALLLALDRLDVLVRQEEQPCC